MARTNLKAVSVYLNEQQDKALMQAAGMENRSVSNYLLTLGLQRAEELGIDVYGVVNNKREAPRKKAASR